MNVVIACFRGDRHWARICGASVRHWHPEAKIFLLKDLSQGDFSTAEMERALGAELFPDPRRSWGWPWSKLAVFLHPLRERFLFLDSDTVLLGRMDEIYRREADFVVSGIPKILPEHRLVKQNYLDYPSLQAFDPGYRFPGHIFNGGQMILTSGIFRQKDFEPLVEFESTLQNRHPDIFKHGDQGILNYLLAKAAGEGRVRVAYGDFWIWGWDEKKMAEIDLSQAGGEGVPRIVHWAGGDKFSDFRKIVRRDILDFYEARYYRAVPRGKWKRAGRRAGLTGVAWLKKIKRALIGPQTFI